MDIPDPEPAIPPLTAQLERIERIRDMLRAHPHSPTAQRRMDEAERVEQVYSSNAIEGNRLTLRETELVLRGLTIGGRELKDHIEASNLARAWDHMRTISKTPMNEAALTDLHAIVLAGSPPGDAGVYRRVQVWVTGSRLVPANPASIAPKVTQLFNTFLANDEMHPVLKAADLHAGVARIHPFIDGNGRVSRLIQNMALNQAGYWPAVIQPEGKLAYYEALEASDAGDPTLFRAYIAGRVLDAGQRRMALLGP
jgi:Fic family protein